MAGMIGVEPTLFQLYANCFEDSAITPRKNGAYGGNRTHDVCIPVYKTGAVATGAT